MTTYNIDFSDPLRTGFSISPGEFNGPGGTGTPQTSLRLYGRGALEWGESVDENLVRIHENFAGATAPVYPVGGMLWMREQLYVKVGSVFYRWNLTTPGWDTITVTTIAGPITGHSAGTSPGQYTYSTADATLYRWDTSYRQTTPKWQPRAMTVQGAAPTTQKPIQDLLFYDQYSSKWVTPRAATTGVGLPPSGNYDGQLYYDTATGILYIWNEGEGTWQQILGPANEVGAPGGGYTTTSNGNIDMQNLYQIINLKTPLATDLTYAAPVGYVHSYVTAAAGDLSTDILTETDTRYVPKIGPSNMSGTYTLTSGSINATAGSVSAGTLTATNGTITTLGSTTATIATAGITTGNISTANITNGNVAALSATNATITNLSVTSSLDMTSDRIINVATPVTGTDAANAAYVTTAATNAQNGAIGWAGNNASIINPGTYKNGDIHIPGTGKIYMWLDNGFRQIWPATYS
jgi:hypothetical protein